MIRIAHLVISLLAVDLLLCHEERVKVVDKSAWVDPNDMINFDRRTNSMRAAPPVADDESPSSRDTRTSTNQPRHLVELENQLSECRSNLLQQLNSRQQCPSRDVDVSVPTEVHIFRHLLSKMDKKFRLNLHTPSTMLADRYFSAEITLKKAQLSRWSKLLTETNPNMNTIQDCMDDFVSLFDRVQRRTDPLEEPGWFQVFTKNVRYANFALLIFLLIPLYVRFLYGLVNVSRRVAVTLIFFTILTISTFWTWLHLFKIKQAELNARFAKSTIPGRCLNPNTVSESALKSLGRWVKGLFSFAPQDECVQFQKDLLIDPFWEVTPLEALSVTITRFFVEPLEHVGEGFARFFKALLKDVPLAWWPFLLVFVFVFVLILMFFVCGYRMRAFYGLFLFEPAPVARQQVECSRQQAPALQTTASAPNMQISGTAPLSLGI